MCNLRRTTGNRPPRFPGLANGTRVFTALTILNLVEEGMVRLDSVARELQGDDLPLTDERVTTEHLLAHQLGIGGA